MIVLPSTGEVSLILTGSCGKLNLTPPDKQWPQIRRSLPLHSRHSSRVNANAKPNPIFPRPSRCFFVGFEESYYYQPPLCINLGSGGLTTLGGGNLLAVLVVPDTRGRSTVATTDNGTDTAMILSA